MERQKKLFVTSFLQRIRNGLDVQTYKNQKEKIIIQANF